MKPKLFIFCIWMVVVTLILLFLFSDTIAQPPIPSKSPLSEIANICELQLIVLIHPQEAVAAGAGWRLADEPGDLWRSGMLKGFPVADRQQKTVVYKEIPGWITPQNDNITISCSRGISGISREGYYTRKVGALTVTIQPQEAVAAGAQWVATSGADALPWQNSGTTVSNLREASWEVRFKSLNDARWIIPEPMNVNITTGQTTRATAFYKRAPGLLSVVIFPAELRQAGAQWRVVQGQKAGAWQSSEAVLPVPEGPHQLEFKEVAGWIKPATQDLGIASLQNIQLRGEYRRQAVGLV